MRLNSNVRFSTAILSKNLFGNASYYMFWLIISVGKGLGYTSVNPIFQSITWAAMLFLLFKLLLTDFRRHELLVCVFLVLLGMAVWYFSQKTDVLLTILAVIGMKHIDIAKLMWLILCVRTPMFVAMTSMAALGFIDAQRYLRYLPDGSIIERYALGYAHPNSAQFCLFFIVALIVLLHGRNIKAHMYIIICVYNMFIYSYTDSRTGMIMIFILLSLNYISRYRPWQTVITNTGRSIYYIVPLLSVLICLLLAKLDWPDAFAQSTLYSRFDSGAQYINAGLPGIFGTSDVVTDLGFVAILYMSGVIVFLLFIVCSARHVAIFAKKQMWERVCVFICYAIYAFSESYTLSVLMNASIIYFSMAIFGDGVVDSQGTQNGIVGRAIVKTRNGAKKECQLNEI